MDRISFTGFNNVKVVRDVTDKIVPCMFSDGIKADCRAKYFGVTVNCDLFNGSVENNNHLQQFYDIMQKAKQFFINPERPQHIEMCIEKFKILNNSGNVISISRDCSINGRYINLDESADRIFLPFYTFMAHLLKEINKSCNLPEKGHAALTQANKVLHNKAVNFIDNIM